MAVSGGHLLVPKALRVIRFALEKTGRVLRDKLPQTARTIEAEAQPVTIGKTTQRQPVNRIATSRQTQSRWYSTQQASQSSTRQFSSRTRATPKYDRASLPSSRTSQAVNRLTSRAPFASSLRPNLTGGTLCRSAGGYGTGAGRFGGARYFSHTPAAPAQVISNVSQAVRAFCLSGQRAQFDGMSARNEKRFKTVSAIQQETAQKMRSVPRSASGSYLDFKVTPTITAIGPLSSIPTGTCMDGQESLTNAHVMKMLSVDFARALKDLTIIMNDLEKLASLGDLPLSLPNSSTLRIRFPGCDRDSVNRLCEELDINRGLIYQDEDFDTTNGTEMALLFPFAPSQGPSDAAFSFEPWIRTPKEHDELDWQHMLSPPKQSSPSCSLRSITSSERFEDVQTAEADPWLSTPSGYSSLTGGDNDDTAAYFGSATQAPAPSSSEFEGLEGIYRFLEECDRARR